VDRQVLAILDFGSQYTQLIARRVRELNVYSKIFACDVDPAIVAEENPIGLILSGGPGSVYAEDAPQLNRDLLFLDVPILGICYGMQAVIKDSGGIVDRGEQGGEYGLTRVRIPEGSPLFVGLPETLAAWMSHGDRVEKLPPDFEVIASSEACPAAAVQSSGFSSIRK
jgi:GMP synthase (glutamine-hydrolysing)